MSDYSDQPERLRRPPTMPVAGGASPVPAPPRALTPHARRQSWHEPSVRFWSAVVLGLVLIALWSCVDQFLEYRHEKNLIEHGTSVDATIIYAIDSRVGHEAPRETPAKLQFQLDGQAVTVSGTLDPPTDYIRVGDHVTLHVNKDDPAEWTDHTQPVSIGRRMIVGYIIFPVALAAALAALLLRRRALRLWASAPALPYSVVDTRHSAIAPRSHVVRCVSASRGDGLIVSVFLPAKFPKPKSGELLWLLHHPGKTGGALAAPAYL